MMWEDDGVRDGTPLFGCCGFQEAIYNQLTIYLIDWVLALHRHVTDKVLSFILLSAKKNLHRQLGRESNPGPPAY